MYYYLSLSEVMEWLEAIALNHENLEVRQKMAQGIADIKLPYLDNRDSIIADIADVYLNQKQYEKALIAYLRGVPTTLLFNVKIARSYTNSKQFYQAIIHCKQWLEKEQKNSWAYSNLGSIYRKLGLYQKAEEAFNHAIEIRGKKSLFSINHWQNLAWTYHDWGKYEEAIKTYQCAIEIDSKNKFNSRTYNNLGLIYHDLRHYDQAISAYNEAIKLDSKNSYAYNNLGYFYSYQKQWDKAIHAFNTAIEFNPFYSHAYCNLGLVYLLQDNFSEAEYYLLTAIKVNSYDGDAVLKLAILQALQGNFEQAKKSWQKGLKLYGEYAQHERLFRTLYTIALGEKEQGLATLQTIITEEKPPVGLLNLVLEIANLLVKCPEIEGIDQAITMIKKNINDLN